MTSDEKTSEPEGPRMWTLCEPVPAGVMIRRGPAVSGEEPVVIEAAPVADLLTRLITANDGLTPIVPPRKEAEALLASLGKLSDER